VQFSQQNLIPEVSFQRKILLDHSDSLTGLPVKFNQFALVVFGNTLPFNILPEILSFITPKKLCYGKN
jgi:hypothetical protein